MIINWFPGHMSKSLKGIEDTVKKAGAVIYVLDARAPLSCINPSFAPIISGKPTVYVLNKSDMVNSDELQPFVSRLSGENTQVVKLNATASGASKVLAEKLKQVTRKEYEKKKAKGINPVLKAIVIGVPNSGKSTLINNLCGKSKAVAGNKAGVTKMQQLIRVNDYLEVLDTPGTLYPKLDNYETALNLAFIGSIKDEVLDTFELSLELIKKLTLMGLGLKDRYGFEPLEDPLETLKMIAVKRGFVLKGNEIDIERAAYAVLDDFRKGRMGKILLDKLA